MDSWYFVIFLVLFMVLFFKRKKNLWKTWDKPVDSEVYIHEKQLTCPVCHHTRFSKREAKIATTWIPIFFSVAWNKSASCYVCSQCGFMQSFAD